MRQQTFEERLELYVKEERSKEVSSNKLLLAASAVAGVGAILVPPPAEAAIVYSGVRNLEVKKVGDILQSQSVDFDGNAGFLFRMSSSIGATFSYFSQTLAVNVIGTMAVIRDLDHDPKQPANLPGNYTVSSNRLFNTLRVAGTSLAANGYASGSTQGGQFLNQQGFLGVKFEIESNTHYGWIQYKTNVDASIGTIIDWAYEDVPGKEIKTGDTVSSKKFNWNLFLPAIINGSKDQ